MWATEWKETSFWLDGMAPISGVSTSIKPDVDVLIIGSGYTGLHAALQTARAGKEVLVVEKGYPGYGCSTRNGGQISTSVKPSQNKLEKKVGSQRASAIRQEGEFSLEWIEGFVSDENIDCDFSRCGRFHAAHSPEHYEMLARDSEVVRNSEKIPSFMVTKQDQFNELGTDLYHGGIVFPRHASLHPAKYHHGLLSRVLEAGAHVVGQCEAQRINKTKIGFEVKTAKGVVKCKDVVVATNGYTSPLTPWLQRRVIPIGSYIIATDEIQASLMNKLFPTNRIVSDTCKVVYYYRPSPDHKRILFGGRVSAKETDPSVSGPKLYQDLIRIFPDLEKTKVTHSWLGQVAYTFDELAHTGSYDGIFYAMGYCGSGVSMASYLGMRLGQKVLGLPEGKTAFDDLPFPTRPLYTGNPWFLPAVVSWYRWRDQRQIVQAQNMQDRKSFLA
ncbi:MAG: FAD-dependent oxidoreductase [Aestuariivita sp.]|nr:FAD-dependent oxidoreductase [Aestuariivita sp.]